MPQVKNYNPSGSVVCPVHTVEIDGKLLEGGMPAIIVYIDNRPKGYRQFVRFCEHIGIGRVVDTNTGASVCGEGAWEVIGPMEALNRLSQHPMIRNWHPVLSASVYIRGSGNGTAKTFVKKKHKDPVPCDWTERNNALQEARKKFAHAQTDAQQAEQSEEIDRKIEELAKNAAK